MSAAIGSKVDLSVVQHLHVVGIGGAGMSAIAAVLAGMGHRVSGSDLKPSRSLERLQSAGASVHVGHRADHVAGATALAISTAVPDSNVEVREARRLGIPVLSRAEMLAAIASLRRVVAVAGTHGKTTTSSMLALVLVEAGLQPSFIVGGDVNEIGTNAAWDEGEWLVVEADESDGTFLQLSPEIGIVTSVERDHLEHYGSFEALKRAFAAFLETSGTAVVCADDEAARSIAPPTAVTYGFDAGASVRMVGFESGRSDLRFELERDDGTLGRFQLPVPGAHNARNAAAAVTAALEIGVDPDDARRALARFGGVARRYEFRGEARRITFVDDYAHLPGEVRAALDTALRGGFERIVCVFQPHRYSRTASLAAEFAGAFSGADILVVAGIYASGEAPRPGVTGKLILDAVLEEGGDIVATYLPNHDELVAYLETTLRPGDLCLTLSAGDLTDLASELIPDGRRRA
jgi:UDP-N-acetylmuramate--alanine ligase